MFDNNDINDNNNINNENIDTDFYNNYLPQEGDENLISRYQIDRRTKQSILKRQVRKQRKKINLFRFFAKIFLIIVLFFIITHLFKLSYWKLNPQAFSSLGNTSIKIENNHIVSSEKILRAIQQNEVPNCPIFLLNTEDIKRSILEITPVQNVYIKRFWCPARIEVLVQEREPAIVIAPNEDVDPIAFYTKDGTLVGRSYLPLDPSFKTVKVLTYGYGNKNKFDKKRIEFLLTVAKDIEAYSKEPVLHIDLRNSDDVYVKIPTVNIKLGSISQETYPDTLKKITGLPAILPKVKMLDKKVKYVDLRWQNNLYYIKLAE